MGCKKKKKSFIIDSFQWIWIFILYASSSESMVNVGLLNQFKLRFFPDRFRNISSPARARGTLDARGD